MTAMYRSRVTAALVLLCLLAGCSNNGDALDRIEARGKLKVVSRNSPTTLFTDKNGPTGFEYALAGLLAQELGVELEMEPAFSLESIFEILQRGEADLAAAGLTLTEQRRAIYPHSASYYRLKPQVVYKTGNFRPRSLGKLAGLSIVVLATSSHSEALGELQRGDYPDLQWREIVGADTMELLELVDTGQADLAVIDSNEFSVQQSLYPRLKVAFELGAEQDMVWFLAPGVDNERLLARINTFIQRLQDDGSLALMREEHFGHSDNVSRIGSHTFNLKMRSRLPKYQDLIRQVAAEYQMDWELLAAIAYQESHWNPEATSPTGVRGMMMLTLPTASEMAVENRLDPAQSLRGGARYFKNIKRRLPRDITEPDRTWLALAAYNIGMGHLEDARVITERHGGDPDLWQDVLEHLPLLQKPKYYQNTRYGYARGVEAATYVQNIRHYHSILQWQHIADNKPQPPLEIDDFLPAVVRDVSLLGL
jgi:peptidoglycan lytic transglycosylase F